MVNPYNLPCKTWKNCRGVRCSDCRFTKDGEPLTYEKTLELEKAKFERLGE